MTRKELRRLSRAELLEMLIQQEEELNACKEQLARAQAELESRQIKISNAGSIAEAALQVSGIFEAAQRAADQYLSSVNELSARQEEVCARMEAETKRKCDAMVEKAQADSQRYWDDISRRMEDFYEAHAGLRELLAVQTAAGQKTAP